jgi:2-keto-4-pentenoate hydratase/2-oxohepta-3-ene-1,7-dioic acid hydratase in catechol pathway
MQQNDPQDHAFAPTGVVLAQAGLPEEISAIWLVHQDRALPLSNWAEQWSCARFAQVTELVREWATHHTELRRLIEQPETSVAIAENGLPVGSLTVEAPLQPAQLFCTIGNYQRQVIEAAVDGADPADGDRLRAATVQALKQRRRHGSPYVCLTSIDRIAAPISELVLDPDVDTLDWEVEIGAVIGGSGSKLTPSEAEAVVAGYCVVNDLTIRSRIIRPDLPAIGSDWLQCKGLHGSLPLGPWFVPAWQVPDPSALRLQLSLNGTLMQDDTADDMVFTIAEQLSYLSRHTRLHPGDILCTGSPAGFGVHHGRFLRAGDTVKASVSGLGEQITRCMDPASQSSYSHQSYSHPNPATQGGTMTKEHAL